MRQDEYCDGIAENLCDDDGKLMNAGKAWAAIAIATYLRENRLTITDSSSSAESTAQAFNRGIETAVAFLRDWTKRGDYIQSSGFFAVKIAAMKLSQPQEDGGGTSMANVKDGSLMSMMVGGLLLGPKVEDGGGTPNISEDMIGRGYNTLLDEVVRLGSELSQAREEIRDWKVLASRDALERIALRGRIEQAVEALEPWLRTDCGCAVIGAISILKPEGSK